MNITYHLTLHNFTPNLTDHVNKSKCEMKTHLLNRVLFKLASKNTLHYECNAAPGGLLSKLSAYNK